MEPIAKIGVVVSHDGVPNERPRRASDQQSTDATGRAEGTASHLPMGERDASVEGTLKYRTVRW